MLLGVFTSLEHAGNVKGYLQQKAKSEELTNEEVQQFDAAKTGSTLFGLISTTYLLLVVYVVGYVFAKNVGNQYVSLAFFLYYLIRMSYASLKVKAMYDDKANLLSHYKRQMSQKRSALSWLNVKTHSVIMLGFFLYVLVSL